MKKIVLALFAAAAMVFGLAGCSGDLHDNPGLCYAHSVAGNITAWNPGQYPLVVDSPMEYHLDFNSGSNTAGEFKIVPNTGWDPAFGGSEFTVNGDWKKFKEHKNDAANCTITLVANTDYRILIKVEGSDAYCKVVTR